MLNDQPVAPTSLLPGDSDAGVRRTVGTLPSRAADNIFWLGRYVERIEIMLRVLRAYVIRAAESPVDAQPASRGTAADDGRARRDSDRADRQRPARDRARRRSAGRAVPLSIASTAQRAFDAASRIRDRFAPDAWRALRDLTAMLSEGPRAERDRDGDRRTDLRHLAGPEFVLRPGAGEHDAAVGLALPGNGSPAGAGDRHHPTGAAVRRPGRSRHQAAESLDALLELADSVISYRQRYSITATRSSVVDLVALDPEQSPLDRFPGGAAGGTPAGPVGAVAGGGAGGSPVAGDPAGRRNCARRAPASSTRQRLAALDDALLGLSDAIARTYLVDRSRLARPIEPM